MTKAAQFALTNKIDFNEKQVSEKIEEFVSLTKQVNVKSRVTEKAEAKKEIEEVSTQKMEQTTALKSCLQEKKY